MLSSELTGLDVCPQKIGEVDCKRIKEAKSKNPLLPRMMNRQMDLLSSADTGWPLQPLWNHLCMFIYGEQKVVLMRLELMTLELLAPRSNLLS